MKDFIKAVLLVIGFLILISCVAKGDDNTTSDFYETFKNSFVLHDYELKEEDRYKGFSVEESNSIAFQKVKINKENSYINFNDNTFNVMYRVIFQHVITTLPTQYPDDIFFIKVYGYEKGKIKLLKIKWGNIKPKQIIPEKFMIGTQEITF